MRLVAAINSRAELLTSDRAMFSGKPSGGAALLELAVEDHLSMSLIAVLQPLRDPAFALLSHAQLARLTGFAGFYQPDPKEPVSPV